MPKNAGDPVIDKHGSQDVEEISVSADDPAIAVGAVALALIMQGVEEGRVGELVRPEHGGWPDQKSAAETGETNADQLRAECEEQLEAPSQVDIVEGLALQCEKGVGAVGVADRNVGHQGDDYVLLDCERSGVQSPLKAEGVEHLCWHDFRPQATDRVDEQLDDDRGEVDSWTPVDTFQLAVGLRHRSPLVSYLILKNMFSPLPIVTKIIPRTQARTVFATSSPSVLRTAALTSS